MSISNTLSDLIIIHVYVSSFIPTYIVFRLKGYHVKRSFDYLLGYSLTSICEKMACELMRSFDCPYAVNQCIRHSSLWIILGSTQSKNSNEVEHFFEI